MDGDGPEQVKGEGSDVREAPAAPSALGIIGAPFRPDYVMVDRLRRAAAEAEDPNDRALLLASIAIQQHDVLAEPAYDGLLYDAERLAGATGDAAVDDLIFAARLGLRRSPSGLQAVRERISARLEHVPNGEPNAAIEHLAMVAAFRSGDLQGAERHLARYIEAAGAEDTTANWTALRARAALSFAQGNVELARLRALEAVKLAYRTPLDATSLDHFGFQLLAILRERMRVADARPTAETWVDQAPSHTLFRAMRAWVRAEMSDHAGARTDLEVFFAQSPAALAQRRDGLIAIAAAVGAASTIGDPLSVEWCNRGHALLEPYADEWLVVGDVSLVEGPVLRVMALASSAVGRHDRALRENDAALQAAQSAGASLFIWHAIRDRGLLLARAGREEEAARELTDAAQRYRSAGLDGQAASWSAKPDVVSAASDPPADTIQDQRAAFERVDEGWRISFGDETCFVRHRKGLSMLHALLCQPGEELSALALSSVGEGAAAHELTVLDTSQPVVDDEAIAAYRRRLDALAHELDRADRRGDVEASNRVTAEFDAIAGELAAARGLGGQPRVMTDEAERARVRVTKSIRAAIQRIDEVAPAAAAHLEANVRTGRFCVYDRGATPAQHWQL